MSSPENSKPHKRLLAWQRSMDLYVEIHQLTATFPQSERYLVSQIRSAALSAPSNIAEGAAEIAAILDECLRLTYGLKRSL